MTISDGFMIIAVILGPILAVQVQKQIESWRRSRENKLYIFKNLMATRATPLSPRHVEALNMIDLEFPEKGSKEKAVREAWKIYLDHLNDAPRDPEDPTYQSKLDAWGTKKSEYLVDLLYAMSQLLGYTFDKVHLKKAVYIPQAYSDLENDLYLIRRGTLDLLKGEKALLVELTPETKSIV